MVFVTHKQAGYTRHVALSLVLLREKARFTTENTDAESCKITVDKKTQNDLLKSSSRDGRRKLAHFLRLEKEDVSITEVLP